MSGRAPGPRGVSFFLLLEVRSQRGRAQTRHVRARDVAARLLGVQTGMKMRAVEQTVAATERRGAVEGSTKGINRLPHRIITRTLDAISTQVRVRPEICVQRFAVPVGHQRVVHADDV